jgi:hypothetical protein
MRTKIIYLGFVIFANKLKMDPKKIKVIKDWPLSKSVFEVRTVISQNSTIILSDRMSQKIHFCESWFSKITFPAFNSALV